MRRLAWLFGGFALGHALSAGFFAARTLPPPSPPESPASFHARRRGGGSSAAVETTRWEAEAGFERAYREKGLPDRRAIELLDLRESDEDPLESAESSLAALAASLDRGEVEAALSRAKTEGAAPEVVAHYQYLKDVLDAFLEGRLPELLRRIRGA